MRKETGMHELGIVDYVIRNVESVAEQNKLTKVIAVKLEFGEVSGIVPDYLKNCWDWMVHRGHPVLEEAEFTWDIIPAFTVCEDCQKTYRTVDYGKTCPYCGGGNTYLLEGNSVMIKQIAGV